MSKHIDGSVRSGIDRRSLLGAGAALGGAALLCSTFLAKPAIAQTKTITVTTMPGPRWEGALQASAKAYQAANPGIEVKILGLALCRALPAYRHQPRRRLLGL